MPTLFRDFETRSTLDLPTVGAWKYSVDPSTDIWCAAYAVDDGPIQLWLPGDPVPAAFIEAAQNPDWIVSAFNDGFERAIETHILTARHGFPTVPIERHRCTMAAARAAALPGELKNAALALGLEHQKDQDGSALMLRMAKPRKPRKGEDPKGIYWHDDPVLLERLYSYCKQDTAVERELHGRIGHLSGEEQALWILDQTINDRGFRVDTALADAAREIVHVAEAGIDVRLAAITDGAVTSLHQRDRILKYLASRGDKIKSLKKKNIGAVLANGLDEQSREILQLRQAGAHAAAIKPESILVCADTDQRIRGGFRYHGASTGRWSGSRFQPQNLKKLDKTVAVAAAIEAVLSKDIERIRALGDPLAVIGSIARPMICAAPGNMLIGADFSGIESRVTAWIAGEQWKLDQWSTFDRTGDPQDEPYYIIGRKTYGLPEKEARTAGKTGDLACGFGGGPGAWRKFRPDDPRSDEQIKAANIDPWRKAHPKTTRFWKALEGIAHRAIRTGKRIELRNLAAEHVDGTLYLTLPSGRRLAYPRAHLAPGKYDNDVVCFHDNGRGQFVEKDAWYGQLVENVVQAIARDLLAEAMVRLEAAGFPIVLHVHDEAVAEVPADQADKARFLAIMTELPEWAVGLPIAAKAWTSARYGLDDDAQTEAKPVTQADVDEINDSLKREGIEPINIDTGAAEEIPETPKPAVEAPIEDDTMWRDRDNDHRRQHDDDGYQSGEEPRGRTLIEYIYLQADGAPYLKVVRTDAKQFPQFHWEGNRWLPKPPKGPKIPFGLPELIATPPDVPICITEGEKDHNTLVALGFVATTNSGGAGGWTADLNQWFAGRNRVYLFQDNDDDGRKRTTKITRMLRGIVPNIHVIALPGLKHKEDVTDWLEQRGGTKQMLLAILDEAAAERQSELLNTVQASTVEIVATVWMWLNRFALGEIGIVTGLPDEGKGQILAFIAGRVTTGGAWPMNEGTAPKGNVIMLSAEESPHNTLVPRLKAAGADLSRIHIVQMTKDATGERMFSLVTDLPALRRTIETIGDVVLVTIDPVGAYFGLGKVDSFRGNDVRAVLSPLKALAEELEIAIIGVIHFNKKVDVTNILLRMSDSLVFGAAPRHVFGAINDAENKRKLFIRAKNNSAAADANMALSYTFDAALVGRDKRTGVDIIAPHIVWGTEYVDVTASEAMQAAADNKAPAARDDAAKLLQNLLAAGPIPRTEIEEAAEGNGISRSTLFRAKKALKVEAYKDRSKAEGKWMWRLPEAA